MSRQIENGITFRQTYVVFGLEKILEIRLTYFLNSGRLAGNGR